MTRALSAATTRSSSQRFRSSTMRRLADRWLTSRSSSATTRAPPSCPTASRASTSRRCAPREVIVVDASSTDASVAVATAAGARVARGAEPRPRLPLQPRRRGGHGRRTSLLLNNDVALEPRCLELLAAELDADERRFAADPTQLDWDGERVDPRAHDAHPRAAAARVPARPPPRPGRRRPTTVRADASARTAPRCSSAARCFAELGGFDETFFLEWEDLDLCWRAWARGWPSVYVPATRACATASAPSRPPARAAEALGVVAPQPRPLRAQVPARAGGRARRRGRAAAAAAPPARGGAAASPRSCRELPEIRRLRRRDTPSTTRALRASSLGADRRRRRARAGARRVAAIVYA